MTNIISKLIGALCKAVNYPGSELNNLAKGSTVPLDEEQPAINLAKEPLVRKPRRYTYADKLKCVQLAQDCGRPCYKGIRY